MILTNNCFTAPLKHVALNGSIKLKEITVPAAPCPPDEVPRLRALATYDIMDTPPDPRIDVFVRMAAQFYDVPTSLVSLIDKDRQWFKAAVGIDVKQTPRELAFCAHAILSPAEVLVVEDATRDPRFADNPLVTGAPNIRFYAGAPILDGEGYALGTLCIVDSKPRTLDETGRRRLADMAIAVGSTLDLHRSRLHLQRTATHDPLTGLVNRALFDSSLNAAVEEARVGRECAVLCLDLDGFKAVNDQLGHAAGDAVLHVVADRLRASVRRSDLVARLGSDEFAVLMPGPLLPGTPRDLATRIIDAFAAPLRILGEDVALRTSIGFAVAPDDGMEGAALLRAADMALYRAKGDGRGRVVRHRDKPGGKAGRHHRMLDDLRTAIDTGGFTLAWQPCVEVRSGRTYGQEALLRWTRPGHGPESSEVFIALAERFGLVRKLDAWVLETACRQASAWPVAQCVTVNVTPVSFCAGDLPQVIADVLARTGLAPERLVLEVTERMALERPGIGQERINQLHQLGVRVALGDFGTGYSALSCLKEFSFDIIKLDKSFIRDIGRNVRSEAIVRSVIQLGRSIGMFVCAEGVETLDQLVFLQKNDCDLAQGYLHGAPTADPQFGKRPNRDINVGAARQTDTALHL